jgi:hypothetical protein
MDRLSCPSRATSAWPNEAFDAKPDMEITLNFALYVRAVLSPQTPIPGLPLT